MNRQTSILTILTKQSFKANRTRNRVAILAIVLTTLMFTSLFTLSQSMSKNLLEMTFRQTGYDAQVSIKSITEEQTEKIASHPDVKEVGKSIVLGLAENEKLAGRQVEIRWADDSYAAHSFSMPTTGTMPKADDEIVLDTMTLDTLGIPHKLGETVTLKWRKDVTGNEFTTSDFKLCGYGEGNQSSYASMAWVSRAYADKMISHKTGTGEGQVLGLQMAQVSLLSDRHIDETMDNILKETGLSDLEYGVNLAYSPEMNATAAQETIPMYLGMLLVFVAGYLIIYNIFQISVTADIQFYGRLKTLGTTTRQIKKLVYGQANRLCVFGIPIGLILGYLLGIVLVPILLGVLEGKASVSASPLIFLGSALFTWLTALVSCLRPSRLAGKVSPMEALRYCDTKTAPKKKFKKGQSGATMSGMAFANLGRNKKRTAMVICSLSLGLVLLSCFYAKNASFDMEKYLSNLTISDFELSDATHEAHITGYNPKGTTLRPELMSQIEALEGLEDIGHMYTHQTGWGIDPQTLKNLREYYTEDKIKDWESYDPLGAEKLQEAIAEQKTTAVLYGLDGIPLDTITEEPKLLAGSFDAQKFASGNYVLAVSSGDIDKDSLGEDKLLPTPSVGSKITIEGKTYTVMAVVSGIDSITGGALEGDERIGFYLEMILPTDYFTSQWPDNTLRKLFFNINKQSITAASEMLKEYTTQIDSSLPVTSRETMEEQYIAETRSSAVIGNAISIVIALVGVLNFVNSMVTAIVSRKKEFAMIQSIGMTKRQLCKMLVFEGLYYAGITLLVSYTISALAVGIGVQAMVAGDFTATFHFTLLPLFVCTPILLAFAVLIPYLCFKNLGKQSIVERLRNE